MFDPTIYDNIKVVLEGAVYDLDLNNKIRIINRKDIVDLATMARAFSLQFQLANSSSALPNVEMTIKSSIHDYMKEMLEQNEMEAGCFLEITYLMEIKNPDEDCHKIKQTINQIWNGRPTITQEVYYTYGEEKGLYNKVMLEFGRKINEDQIDDLDFILQLVVQTLDSFPRINK